MVCNLKIKPYAKKWNFKKYHWQKWQRWIDLILFVWSVVIQARGTHLLLQKWTAKVNKTTSFRNLPDCGTSFYLPYQYFHFFVFIWLRHDYSNKKCFTAFCHRVLQSSATELTQMISTLSESWRLEQILSLSLDQCCENRRKSNAARHGAARQCRVAARQSRHSAAWILRNNWIRSSLGWNMCNSLFSGHKFIFQRNEWMNNQKIPISPTKYDWERLHEALIQE